MLCSALVSSFVSGSASVGTRRRTPSAMLQV